MLQGWQIPITYISIDYIDDLVSTEEKKPAKEESESEDDDMGFGLFD